MCWLYTHFLLSHEHIKKKRQNSHKWRLAQCQMNGKSEMKSAARWLLFHFSLLSTIWYWICRFSLPLRLCRRVFRVLLGVEIADIGKAQSSARGNLDWRSAIFGVITTVGIDEGAGNVRRSELYTGGKRLTLFSRPDRTIQLDKSSSAAIILHTFAACGRTATRKTRSSSSSVGRRSRRVRRG